MLPSTALGKKHLLLLGKLLVSKRPEIAGELYATYFPRQDPFETDHAKIRTYYLLFCKAQKIEPNDFVGRLHKSTKVQQRRLFISVLLHLYYPDVFLQPGDTIIVKHGFIQKIADVLSLSRQSVSFMVKEQVQWEKRYDDYRESVDHTITQLKAIVNASA